MILRDLRFAYRCTSGFQNILLERLRDFKVINIFLSLLVKQYSMVANWGRSTHSSLSWDLRPVKLHFEVTVVFPRRGPLFPFSSAKHKLITMRTIYGLFEKYTVYINYVLRAFTWITYLDYIISYFLYKIYVFIIHANVFLINAKYFHHFFLFLNTLLHIFNMYIIKVTAATVIERSEKKTPRFCPPPNRSHKVTTPAMNIS